MPEPLDSKQRIHLEWMFENQPELVRQLSQSRQLYPLLLGRHQQALQRVDELETAGHDHQAAWEVATAELLAPPDGPAASEQPPEPLPWSEREQIYQRLES